MNSWHSFSPNGRWMVFSSKSRSPYTQMFLTHVDEEGNDTPAILVENSTAANRAVNIPEFVNVPSGGLLHIDAPVTAYYRLIDLASDAMNEGRNAEAIPLLKEALGQDPDDAEVHNSFGCALTATGRASEAIDEFRIASRLSPDYPDAHSNLGSALVESGRPGDAIAEFRKALALSPDYPEAQVGLGGALTRIGKVGEAIPLLLKATERVPKNLQARKNLCLALFMAGRGREAIPHAQEAVTLSEGRDARILDLLGRLYAQTGSTADAAEATRKALDVAMQSNDQQLVNDLRARLSSYGAPAGGKR
jgi:Flp pilus assembly protein TadD